MHKNGWQLTHLRMTKLLETLSDLNIKFERLLSYALPLKIVNVYIHFISTDHAAPDKKA